MSFRRRSYPSRESEAICCSACVSAQSVEPVLNIRTCGATVGDFITGFSVPINALYTMNNMIGVVVAEGGAQTFVEVTVISYPDADTAFVRPVLANSPLIDGQNTPAFLMQGGLYNGSRTCACGLQIFAGGSILLRLSVGGVCPKSSR